MFNKSIVAASIVFFRNKLDGKIDACLGIDPFAVAITPIGEGVEVNINPLDDQTLGLRETFQLLRTLQPLFPGREIIGRFEKQLSGCIVLFPEPRDSDCADIVTHRP